MRFFSKFLNQNKLTCYFKNKRNGIVNRYFLKQTSTQQYEVVEKLKNLDFIVFCIAFNKPDCIQIMIECWKRYALNTTLVVVDNSSCINAKRDIAELCHLNGIFYLSLPRNHEWHPNRSHALAMNWVFYNLVIEIKPDYFGYLDHDCFPYKKFDLSAHLSGHEIYGDRRISYKHPEVWNLWAGFCFYKYDHVKDRDVNFTHSIELGLDTGGKNWNSVYKNLLKQNCNFSSVKHIKDLDIKCGQRFNAVLDSFVHIGSVSHSVKSEKINRGNLDELFNELAVKNTVT